MNKCPENWCPSCICSISALEPNEDCYIHGWMDVRKCPYCGQFRSYITPCKRCGCTTGQNKIEKQMTKPYLIITHANCSDGFCCAWQLWNLYPNAEFHFCNYGDNPPDVTNRNVLMTDFSYKRPVMQELINKATNVVVLDHHKTAKEELAGLEGATIVFDMN